jgi:hypothetical protein
MDASPKRNATVPQILHYMKARTLIFCVRFQDKPQRLAHLCKLDKTQNISFKRSPGTAAKVSRICCSFVDQVFFLLIDRRPLWANFTRTYHTEEAILLCWVPNLLTRKVVNVIRT